MADDGGEITREPSGPVPPEAVSSPTPLIQQVPDIETSGAVLLRQIIVRDTGAESQIASEPAEGAVELGVAPSGIDDLQWLHGPERWPPTTQRTDARRGGNGAVHRICRRHHGARDNDEEGYDEPDVRVFSLLLVLSPHLAHAGSGTPR